LGLVSPISPLGLCLISLEMVLGKIGILLLLFTVICQVNGECTEHDKESVLRDCAEYLYTEYPFCDSILHEEVLRDGGKSAQHGHVLHLTEMYIA
jgi:hypothetical protein